MTSKTPADVTRTDDVQIRLDGRGKWTVERGNDVLGVIFDEGPEMRRGRFAGWAPHANTRGNIAGFFHDPAEAVDAIVRMWPATPAQLAKETGLPTAAVLAEANALVAAWEDKGPRSVFRTALRGEDAMFTDPAAAELRERLAAIGVPAPAPQWRTLKGVQPPFSLYGEDTDRDFRPAGDRKQVTGQPLTITRMWMDHGTRYAEDDRGRRIHLWGVASKYWVAPGPR